MGLGYAIETRKPAESYWTSLRFLLWYRFLIGGLLSATAHWSATLTEYVPEDFRPTFEWLSLAYWVSTGVSIAVLRRYRRAFDVQLTTLVLLDVLTLAVLMFYGGGVRTGMGVMLLVTLAASGLVGQGRLVVFYAACATVAVLVQQVFVFWRFSALSVGDFMHAGVLSTAYFVTAISARLLAARVVANEELAFQRGQALQHQVRISQRVIEDMDDGVVVIDAQGGVQQLNPRAEQLFGRRLPPDVPLINCDPHLHALWLRWHKEGGQVTEQLNLAASGQPVRVRLAVIAGGQGESLLFLEDMARLQAQAQQLKLAALGRLTASIAHEIRNPLSSISHAAELLREDGVADARLMQIVTDNVARLDRIVRDVLEVGRRDRAVPEAIDLGAYLPGIVAEFEQAMALPPGSIALRQNPVPVLRFDRGHLHQVLWNLLSNAARHGRLAAGAVSEAGSQAGIRLWTETGARGKPEIHIHDDGPGVSLTVREHIFEPFFTTHHQGNGLGLYLARELCESNDARLELVEDDMPGAHFRLSGMADGTNGD